VTGSSKRRNVGGTIVTNSEPTEAPGPRVGPEPEPHSVGQRGSGRPRLDPVPSPGPFAAGLTEAPGRAPARAATPGPRSAGNAATGQA
jgi:hypothetical protein